MVKSLTRTAATFATVLVVAGPAMAIEAMPSPEGASVRIISPQDGATVTNPVTVVFGLTGMGVAPAGVELENTGHHHLVINQELPPLDEPIGMSDTLLHFGGGQTEATLELPTGETTLQLLLGDRFHYPHNPPVYSEVITITVE
ncbi:MAG: DUF4399 domain-containing protein [Pseudomonadota bacterium]